MTIRPAEIQDAPGIHQAHMRSIAEVCASDYSPQQVKAWLWPWDKAWREQLIEKNHMWVVEEGGEISGFCDMIPSGEVMALYLVPEALGRGFGRALLEVMEDFARQQGWSSVHLCSTLTARGFYLSQNFVAVPGGKTEHSTRSGVTIPCVEMIKYL